MNIFSGSGGGMTGGGLVPQYSFFNHVFATTEEGKAEILNVVQYALMGILPIVALNKTVQRFIPEADAEKSSVELLAESFIQIVIMFIGIILIHRVITYFPTYSGYRYEHLNLMSVVLAFLVIVLSLRSKLGLKVDILFDRVMELWNGPSDNVRRAGFKKVGRNPALPMHVSSQADHVDDGFMQTGLFPPAPAVSQSSSGSGQGHDYMVKVATTAGGPGGSTTTLGGGGGGMGFEPAPANSVLGGSFF